jgi:hypothetical protein
MNNNKIRKTYHNNSLKINQIIMKKIILTIVININSKKTKKKINFKRKMNFNNINKWGRKMKIIIIIILK